MEKNLLEKNHKIPRKKPVLGSLFSKFVGMDYQVFLEITRSSRLEFFCKNEIFKIFCKIHKKETPVQVFSCAFCEIFKNIYFIEHL